MVLCIVKPKTTKLTKTTSLESKCLFILVVPRKEVTNVFGNIKKYDKIIK